MRGAAGIARVLTRMDTIKNLSPLLSLEIFKVSHETLALYILFCVITGIVYYHNRYFILNLITSSTEKAASDEMLNAAYKLILCGKSQGILRENVRVIGAKQVRNILSPGVQLQNQIKNWPEWVATP